MSAAPLALALPLAAVMLVLATVSLITAIKGKNGTLDPDGRLGVRSEAAASSAAAFTLANKVAFPIVLGAGALSLVLAVLLGFASALLGTVSTIIIFAIGLVGVLALLVSAGRLGDRVARTLPKPALKPGTGGGGCGSCACGSGGCSGLAKAGITRNTASEI